MARELEHYLGPCVAKNLTHECWEGRLYLVYGLEFHALKLQMKLQTESLQAEVAKLNREAKTRAIVLLGNRQTSPRKRVPEAYLTFLKGGTKWEGD